MILRRVGQIGCAAAVTLALTMLPARADEDTRLTLSSAEGRLALSNSKAGGAVFTTDNLAPGQDLAGSITISNDGDLPGAVTLWDSDLVDEPGPGGGFLSHRLRLVVADETERPLGKILYMGGIGALPDVPVGVLQAGERRTYRFIVSFPESAGSDNAFAESSMRVNYNWSAVVDEIPSPAAPRPDVDRHPPVVRLRVLSSPRRLRRGYLTLALRCNEKCRVGVRGRWRIVRRRAALPPAPIRYLAAGRWARVTLPVPLRALRPLRSALERERHVSLRVLVDVRDQAGNRRRFPSRLRLSP